MDNKDRKNIVINILIIISFILFLILTYYLYNSNTPPGFDCYYEYGILNKQYITGKNKWDYLILDVSTEHVNFLRCGHIKNITFENHTYCFPEQKLLNINSGDSIRVEWCYRNNIIGCDKETLENCHEIHSVKKINQ